MSEPFKKESREFVSYTGNFSEALPKDTTRTNSHINRTDNTANIRSGTQSDSRLESHTRGNSVNPGIENNVVIDEHFIRYVGDNRGESVDKIAESVTRSDAGDGANFRFEYSRTGNLNAKVRLAKGSDRTSAGTLSGKAKSAGRFIEKGANAYETLFKSTGEDEIDAAFDTKTDSFLKHIQRKHLKKHDRYRAVRIKATKDIKQLKKEIKAENKTDKQRIHDAYFNKSSGGFVSDTDKFSQFTSSKFSKADSDDASESLFLQVNATKAKDAFIIGSDGKKTTYKFENGTSDSSDYGTGKSSDFNKASGRNASNREMNKQESLEQKKAEKKAAKKREKKEIKRAAAAASVSRMLETKKNISKELRGEQELTGDLLVDGNSGLTRALASNVKKAISKSTRSILSDLGRKLVHIFGGLMSAILPYILVFMAVMFIVGALISFIGGLFHSHDGALAYELDTTSSGYYIGTPYTDEEIQSIIDYLYDKYSDFSVNQEKVIRFALTAVGSAYDQNSHSNHSDSIWDCSELAYCSLLNAGIDISNGGIYTAAEECRKCVDSGYTLEGEFTLKPGDVIFYGGSSNGRYLGVYHVAIYLGNIDGVDRMVEAYGTDRGVIVSDVRNQGAIVNISRVL